MTTSKLKDKTIEELLNERVRAFTYLTEAKELNNTAQMPIVKDNELALMETIILQTSLLIANKGFI